MIKGKLEKGGNTVLKKVRVHIVTEREELLESLFEGARREGAPYTEREHLEMTVEARYHDDGMRVSVAWDESDASGMQGSRTSISYQKSVPGVVTMMRTGAVKTALVFERGQRHHCLYQTPVMPLEVAVATNAVKNEIEAAGKLMLDYAVELRGGTCERTKMTMTVLPYYETP